LVRRLPHLRQGRQEVPRRPAARRRQRRADAPLPHVAHGPGRGLGPPQALPVVHDTARHEHAGRGRRRVRRARALPHDVRPGQAAQRSRDPTLKRAEARPTGLCLPGLSPRPCPAAIPRGVDTPPRSESLRLEVDRTARDPLKPPAIAPATGPRPPPLEADDGPEPLLEFEPLGNVTPLHGTDAHATTRPVFYREPDTLIGVGDERGKPP